MGFVLHLSDEDTVLGLLWANISLYAAFQRCGTDITDYFLLPFFCTVSSYFDSYLIFFITLFIMFIVEIEDKFRHTWLMTVIDTCFQKPPLEIKSFIWSKKH